MEIEDYYKFIHWIKFKHPINYDFLIIDFETFLNYTWQFKQSFIFLIWFKNNWKFLYDEYLTEYLNDEPFYYEFDNSNNKFVIRWKWEKGY